MITSQVSDQVKHTSDGLPLDWIKEVKTRKKDPRKKDVFHIDPKTGYAFWSLKDALRYVETGDINSCAIKPQKRSMEEIKIVGSQTVKTESVGSPSQPSNLINDRKPSDHVAREDQFTSHELPKNWIKELKPRKNQPTKIDPFYIDPETGYAFHSLKDALRYVTTGNILSCMVRPKKRSMEEVQALMSSSEVASISGMKTVQQDSLQLVQLENLHRKRKRSNPVKSSCPKHNEDSKSRTDSATGTPLRRVKQRREGSLCVRASPRLLALKAKIEASYDENHEENKERSNAVPGLSHFPASPAVNMVPNSQPEQELKEEAMAGANGSSTRILFHRGKTCKERPLRASSRLAALEVTTDTTSVGNENSRTRNAVFEPSPSSLFYPTVRPTSQPDLELKEVIKEGASGSSTMTPLQSGKLRREKPMPLRASSCLAALKVTIDTTSVENENSRTSNAVFEPSPSSLSYPTVRPTSQPDLELKEETIGAVNGSSTGTTLRSGKMHRERPTPFRASSRLAALKLTTDTTVGNENSRTGHAVFEPSPSSLFNVRPSSQPDLELKDETIGAANGSSTVTPLRKRKMRRERPLKVSSRVGALKATAGTTSVKNENCITSNLLIEPPPSSLSYQNMQPTSQPDLDFKQDIIEGVNGSTTGTLLQRSKMRVNRSVPLRSSSRLEALKAMTYCTSDENGDDNRSNAVSEQSPSSHPDLNLGSTSQPDLESKEETITEVNGRAKLHSERTATMRASSSLSALSTMEAASDENHEENNKMSNFAPELPPSPACPYLNLGPATQPHRELKEDTVAAANCSATGMSSWRVEPRGEMPTSDRASPYLKTLKVGTEAASNKSNGMNSMTSNYVSEPSHFTAWPDLNFVPSSQFNIQSQAEKVQANGSATWTTLRRVQLHNERFTPVKAMTEAASYVNHEENIEKNNYFREPVDPAVCQIAMGATSQPNPEVLWFDASTAAPYTMMGEVNTPDLNTVPITWPDHQPELQHALQPNPGPKLEQQQPAGVDIGGKLRLQPAVPSEMPYQDPTMDALLSSQEAGPSMPHMSVDPLHSPLSSFLGDFWHDPCLSYAFKTLTGGMDEQQLDLGLGPENYVNGTGPRNGGPSENPSSGLSEATSRTLQFMNNGQPFLK